jgi:hypothetical protein
MALGDLTLPTAAYGVVSRSTLRGESLITLTIFIKLLILLRVCRNGLHKLTGATQSFLLSTKLRGDL